MNMAKNIRIARPNLSAVAPLTSFLVWAYVVFNFMIAYALYVQKDSRALVIYTNITPPVFWAVVFLILTLAMIYGQVQNNWKVTKDSFIVALFVKTIFAYALVYVAYQSGFKAQVGTLALWGLATLTQAGVVIHFPRVPGEGDVDR